MKALGHRVDISINDISAEHVSRVRIRIAEEIGKADGRKRVLVLEGTLVEFHYYYMGKWSMMDCDGSRGMSKAAWSLTSPVNFRLRLGGKKARLRSAFSTQPCYAIFRLYSQMRTAID